MPNVQPGEHSPPSGENESAVDLYLCAQEELMAVSKLDAERDTREYAGLKYVMALYERHKSRPAEVETLFKKHNVKERKGLDIFGRLTKLVCPGATAQLRNAYSNVLRAADFFKKNSSEIPLFIADHGIKAIARAEVERRKGKPTKPPVVEYPLPADLVVTLTEGARLPQKEGDKISVFLMRRAGGVLDIVAPAKKPPPAPQEAAGSKGKGRASVAPAQAAPAP